MFGSSFTFIYIDSQFVDVFNPIFLKKRFEPTCQHDNMTAFNLRDHRQVIRIDNNMQCLGERNYLKILTSYKYLFDIRNLGTNINILTLLHRWMQGLTYAAIWWEKWDKPKQDIIQYRNCRTNEIETDGEKDNLGILFRTKFPKIWILNLL